MTNREEGSTLASYNCDIYMLVFRTTSTTIQNETTKCFSILKYLMWVPTYWSLVTCTISMTDMILKINLMYQVQLPVPWYLRPCYGTCVFHSTRYQVPGTVFPFMQRHHYAGVHIIYAQYKVCDGVRVFVMFKEITTKMCVVQSLMS